MYVYFVSPDLNLLRLVYHFYAPRGDLFDLARPGEGLLMLRWCKRMQSMAEIMRMFGGVHRRHEGKKMANGHRRQLSEI